MSVSRTLLPSPRLRRSTQLLSGLVLFGVSLALLVVADLGLAPWDVFHQGIARSLDLRLGGVVVVVSLLVLVLWIPLRERPGLGTLANAILVGVVFEISIGLIGETSALLGRWALLVGAIVLNAIATGMYVGAGLGPGPRDGLMTAIAARGLLGGSVGLGTVAFAFLIGPLVHRTLPHFTIAASTPIATGIGSGSRSDEFCSE
jgi:uncharacterized membrane protein YczE